MIKSIGIGLGLALLFVFIGGVIAEIVFLSYDVFGRIPVIGIIFLFVSIWSTYMIHKFRKKSKEEKDV